MSFLRSPLKTNRQADDRDRVTAATDARRGGSWFCSAVFQQLSQLQAGQLVIEDALGRHLFGSSGREHWPPVELHVRNPDFYRNTVLGGSLGAAESYLDGDWDTEDLVGVLRLIARNRNVLAGVNGGAARSLAPLRRFWNWRLANSRRGSRRNIAAHYDLGNEFFQLFLDPTMTYSSGIFASPTDSMLDASLNKYERVCQKLQLCSDDHVLEIGTGWGGFAIYAAQRYRCRVTTTTISAAQFKVAQQRIEQAGVEDRVTLLNRDYRDVDGRFDKLVSIEMIEAVGHRYLPVFFRKCASLLARDGLMTLQAITIPEQRYDSYQKNVDFIQRYIFPGGCLPSVNAMLSAIGRATDLQPIHYETFAAHYAKTLQTWRGQFIHNLDQLKQLELTERFLRAWHYYFCYCEAGFRERQIDVGHLVLAKPACRAEIVIPALPSCQSVEEPLL